MLTLDPQLGFTEYPINKSAAYYSMVGKKLFGFDVVQAIQDAKRAIPRQLAPIEFVYNEDRKVISVTVYDFERIPVFYNDVALSTLPPDELLSLLPNAVKRNDYGSIVIESSPLKCRIKYSKGKLFWLTVAHEPIPDLGESLVDQIENASEFFAESILKSARKEQIIDFHQIIFWARSDNPEILAYIRSKTDSEKANDCPPEDYSHPICSSSLFSWDRFSTVDDGDDYVLNQLFTPIYSRTAQIIANQTNLALSQLYYEGELMITTQISG